MKGRRDRRARPPRSCSTTTTTGSSICSSSRRQVRSSIATSATAGPTRPRTSSSMRLSGDVRSLALGDIDGDGDTDIVARLASGRVAASGATRVPRAGRRCARRCPPASATEAQPERGVEIRAGSLRGLRELALTTPAFAPADVSFGLGSREPPTSCACSGRPAFCRARRRFHPKDR